MRLAFPAFVDTSWTGGLNYLRNLFSALAEVPGRPVEPVLFIPADADAGAYRSLVPYLAQAPVRLPHAAGGRIPRLVKTTLARLDAAALAAFRSAQIDLVFYNDAWYGSRFPLPTLAWITDFQHCRMPELFTPLQRAKRSAKFSAYVRHADCVMVSSDDAKADCETFFPASRGRVDVVHFAVQLAAALPGSDARGVAGRYGLPARYFYFPGQLWRHKNHLVLLDALRLLAEAGTPVVVAASGNATDVHHPEHPQTVLARVAEWGLEGQFRFLGHIPYADLMPLMRTASAVLNPSLFEGWSTTVEEAKALGVPLLLSDLPVHREQASPGALFFDPADSQALAAMLARAWNEWPPGPRPEAEARAILQYRSDRTAFASSFIEVARRAVHAHAGRKAA
jgi:glycosyltransferase involved in cell wall biosynthesis